MAPNSTVYAVEGESLTLTWTYDLNNGSFQLMQFDTQGIAYIVQKLFTLAPQIDASYAGRITANVNDSFSSIIFLAVVKADSRSYDFSIQSNSGVTASNVVIVVQGKSLLMYM